MARKQTRYGAQGYLRRRIKNPLTGAYQDVYAKTKADLAEKADGLQAAWTRQLELEASPYFFQYAADWYARVAPDMSADRRRTVAREINSNICPIIGDKRLVELTSDDILDVMAARTARSQSARRTTLQTVNRILDAAEDAGKIPRNPARSVRAGGDRRKKKKALTAAQQQTLLEATEGLRIDLFVKLCLYTGLRREEACGLLWRDVDLDSAAPHITVQRACRWPNGTHPVIEEYLKSDAGSRAIPLPEVLAEELRGRRAGLGSVPEAQIRERCVVGNADGTPWSLKSFQTAWRTIDARSTGTVTRKRKDPTSGKLVKVEIEKRLGDKIPRHNVYITIDFDVTPHTLRRTYITRLILGGLDPRRVQYLAGHATPEITLEYYTDLQDHQPEDLIGPVREVFDK